MCLAIPGKLLDMTDGDPLMRRGRASFAGVVREVSLAFVPEAIPGDYLLVHVGVAISVVDRLKAENTLAALSGAAAPDSFSSEIFPGGTSEIPH